MPSSLALHASSSPTYSLISAIHKYTSIVTFSPTKTRNYRAKMATLPATTSLTTLVAILAILAPTFLFNPFLDYFENLGEMLARYHHHRKHDSGKGKPISVCDDFPIDIPPPDTNATTFLCVDAKGCCNFTTVQSAVDAVANFSMKMTVVWINSGIY